MTDDLAERRRLAALNSYGMLDSDSDPEFDFLAREAAREIGVPFALIALVDEDRNWFKARFGIEQRETPRNISFCTHAIRGTEVMVVPDTMADPRFMQNPLVTGDPGVRFYAGAPLRTAGGQRIGTICVIDLKPNDQMTPAKQARLEALARRTMTAFEKRKARRQAERSAVSRTG